MKRRNWSFTTAIAVLIALLSSWSIASPARGQALGATSDAIVNLFLSSGIDADGPSLAFINEFGVPVLITDIQVGCSVAGLAECRDVRIFTQSNDFNVGFGFVPVSSEDELKSLTTGVLWLPNEELRVFKNGGGRLHIGIAGIKLAA